MDKRKKSIVFILTIIAIIVVIMIVVVVIKKNQERKAEFKGNETSSEVKIKEIEFKDITKEYSEGITTIRANVYNNGETTRSINVKIILKDEEGKEIGNMIQILENVEPKRKKLLSTGIMGDYSRVSKIEMEEISQEEINQYQ